MARYFSFCLSYVDVTATSSLVQVLLSLASSSSSRVSSHLASLGLEDSLQEVLGQRLEEEVVAAVSTLAMQTLDGLVVPGVQVVAVGSFSWLITRSQASSAMAQTQGGDEDRSMGGLEVQQLVEELDREVRRLQGVVREGTTVAGFPTEVN